MGQLSLKRHETFSHDKNTLAYLWSKLEAASNDSDHENALAKLKLKVGDHFGPWSTSGFWQSESEFKILSAIDQEFLKITTQSFSVDQSKNGKRLLKELGLFTTTPLLASLTAKSIAEVFKKQIIFDPKNMVIFEPGCGSGLLTASLLVEISRQLSIPIPDLMDNTYLCDLNKNSRSAVAAMFFAIHPDASFIAKWIKRNLIIDSFCNVIKNGYVPAPNIIHMNPPWETCAERKHGLTDTSLPWTARGAVNHEQIRNTYQVFIRGALSFLAEKNAILSVLAPAGLLSDKTALIDRELILNSFSKCHVFRSLVSSKNPSFSNVSPNVPWCWVKAVRRSAREKSGKKIITVGRDDANWSAGFSEANKIDKEIIVRLDGQLPVPFHRKIADLFERMAKSSKLSDDPRWEYLSTNTDIRASDKVEFNRKSSGNIPVLTGRELRPFMFDNPVKFVAQLPRTVGDLKKMRIGFRKILPDSQKKIAAAIVPSNAVCWESVICLNIPTKYEDVGYLILALANSLAVEVYYRSIINNMNFNSYRIGQLPFPKTWSKDLQNMIAKFRKCLELKKNVIEIQRTADELAGLCFKITPREWSDLSKLLDRASVTKFVA